MFTLTMSFLIDKIVDFFAVFSYQRIRASFRLHGRRLPGFAAKVRKGVLFGIVCSLIQATVYAYMLACVALRIKISTASPVDGILIVLGMSMAKQALMFLVASIACPALGANFAGTDVILCAVNVTLTFGTRLLVTSEPEAARKGAWGRPRH